MRYWRVRFVATFIDDSTRPLQVLSVIGALARIVWLMYGRGPINLNTRAVFFYWFGEDVWISLMMIGTILQLFAVGTRWWKLKLAAAAIQGNLLIFSTLAYILTYAEAQPAYLLFPFIVAEIWIALRALHDRTDNSVEFDRRM